MSSPKCRAAIPTLPPILVGGHLDSWDLGTGAIDDGAGVAIATAAAKRIMDAGRPLRTIRIVWFGAEEVGPVRRPRLPRQDHGKEPHHALLESDFGADRIWKVDSKLGEAPQGRGQGDRQRRWRRSASSPARSTRRTAPTSAR